MTIIINKKNLSTVVHITANTTLTISGNSIVSNIAIADSDEVITGANINQIWYGTGNGAYWEIKRGSNTVFVTDKTGYIDFAGNGIVLNNDNSATFVANLVGAGPGVLIVEFQKLGTTSTY